MLRGASVFIRLSPCRLSLIVLYLCFITDMQALLWARTPLLSVFIFFLLFSVLFYFSVCTGEAAQNHPQRLEDHCICS